MLKKSTRSTLALLFLSLFCSFAEAAAASPRAPENDHSLTPAQYVSAGAPASDRAWIGRDYLTAAKALSELANKNTALLPRYGSAQSGSYFARMISTDNLADADNKRLSLESRVRLLVESGQSLNRVLLLYAKTRNPECTFDQEMVALMAHNLRIYARLIPLMVEFSASLRPSDPEYDAWVNSLSQLRSGGTNMVNGRSTRWRRKTSIVPRCWLPTPASYGKRFLPSPGRCRPSPDKS